MDLTYYVGSCKDLHSRVRQHNQGFVKSTKRYLPWQAVFFEEHTDLRSARRRELQIKSWKKRAAIGELVKHFKNSKQIEDPR